MQLALLLGRQRQALPLALRPCLLHILKQHALPAVCQQSTATAEASSARCSSASRRALATQPPGSSGAAPDAAGAGQAGGPVPVQKLLVANRGEIACRVLATARKLGIPTVAVFSEADRGALHARSADSAVCIGPAAARNSYLLGDTILQVAEQTGATAIHPGYGFLSENPAFARACEERGVTFVGPPAAAIQAMGDKSEAKAMMTAAGVPVVPGYHGAAQDLGTLMGEALKVGFPLLVKATRGGGGKGMKLARSEADLKEALLSAKREAAASFGDDRILFERFIERPRHIEVQVFADAHDNAVYLFERDCSVQRRHQKVIEEAPAPNISSAFRNSIGEAAVAAARAVGYRNAGTVEFIVDTDSGDYYFMEMNTRLQVEHPVTEAVTGQDLVEWQLRVAAGQPLPLLQHQLQLKGHAFEARLYAESPERDFLPGAGTVRRWRLPQGAESFQLGSDIRIDGGVQEGDAVGVHYDPMIAKVIASGADRDTALANLRTALSQLQVSGLPTNRGFLQRLASHPAFVAAELDTSFIPKHHDALMAVAPVPPHVFAAAVIAHHRLAVQKAAALSTPRLGAWNILDSKRLCHELTTHSNLSHPLTNSGATVSLTFHADDSVSVEGETTSEDGSVPIASTLSHIRLDGNSFAAEINGCQLSADLATFPHGDAEVLDLWIDGENHEFHFEVARKWGRRHAATRLGGGVVTPMPGKIISVLVQTGDEVEEGTPLVVLEAMKMEHTVKAPAGGTVAELGCFPGQQVPDGFVFLTLMARKAAATAA